LFSRPRPDFSRLRAGRGIFAPLVIAPAFLAFVYAARPIARRIVAAIYEGRTGVPWLHHLVRHGPQNTLEAYGARSDLFVVRAALLLFLGGSIVWAARHSDRVRATFQGFFGETGSAVDLAVFRMVLFGTIFYCAEPATIRLYAGLPRELLTPPLGFGLAARIFPFDPRTAAAGALLLRGVCLLGIVGLFTRSAAFAITLLTYYVLGIPQCFGQVDHYHFLAWFSLLMAFSRCGDALSIDSLLMRRRGAVPPSESTIYSRPIRWVWILMGIIYLFPGLWKLWLSGDRWFFGDALASHMYVKWAELRWVPNHRIDRVAWLVRAAGLGAIAFEVSFLPLVLHRRTRAFVAVAGLAFHNLSNAFMGISFFWLQLMYASFVPWSRWLAPLFGGRPAANGAAPSPRESRTLDLVGALLLASNAIMGGLMLEGGWPIACFPTFARNPRRQTVEMQFSAVSGSGQETPIDAWPLIQRLGTERWVPLTRRASQSRMRASALARWVADHSPEAGNAAQIMVYCVRRSAQPESRQKGPNSREFLVAVPR
jgi:HTTM domain